MLSMTLGFAFVATLLLLLLGLPLAYWLNTTRFRGIGFLEALVALPAVLPSTVLGFYLFVLWRQGLGLPASFFGLSLGAAIFSLPFAVRPFQAALRAASPEVLAAARLDASPWQVFSLVQLPVALPGIAAGAALAFARSLGVFGVVVMFGVESKPIPNLVASVALVDAVAHGDYAQAHALAAVLMIISFGVIWAVTHWQHRARLTATI